MKPVFKPQTEWLPPESFPDLSKYDEISIDLETKDPDLKSTGSGSIVGNGKVVGIAVAVEGWSGYYPIAHEGGGNMDIRMVLNWFTDVLKTPAIKIFHNAMYDVCWIRSMGLKIEGKIVDTMIAGSLVDENRFRYDLGSLGRDYVGLGKSEAVLKETAAHWGIDAKSEMYDINCTDDGKHYSGASASMSQHSYVFSKAQSIIDTTIEEIKGLTLYDCHYNVFFEREVTNFHQDNSDENSITLIYYCNATVNKEGGTEIFFGDKNEVTSILPVPGRVMIMRGNCLHRATSFRGSRRFTIAFKYKP